MRGRKPIPPHLKVVKAGARKRRAEIEAQATPLGDLPTPPAFLCTDAKAEWSRVAPALYALRLLTDLDVAVLGAYCTSFATWKQAREAMQAEGLTVTTKSANVIPNPLLGIANKAAADMVRYAAEFGITPTSRARLPVPHGQLPGDAVEDFFN